MSGYNVLALDGGGCRGIITAVLIEQLANEVEGFVDHIDLFAGTSIGAANAISLAVGHPPSRMPEFYVEHGKGLFSRPFLPGGIPGAIVGVLERVPLIGSVIRKGGELFWPKWSNQGLRDALEGYFGSSARLADVRRRVMLTTMSLSGRLAELGANVVIPRVIHNFPGSPDLDLDIRSALLRSMSAPTYFPSSPDGYVDGGVFACNPGLAAFATAVSEAKCAPEDIRILSIGVGLSQDAVPTKGPLTWGLLKWGEHMADVSVRTQAEFDAFVCRTILGDRYCRLNVVLPPGKFPMDDYRTIPQLAEIAREATQTEVYQRAREFARTYFS